MVIHWISGGAMAAKKKTKSQKGSKRQMTIKQRRFVAAVIKGVDKGTPGYKAAKKAGYKGDKASLCAAASRLLRNDNVLTPIQMAMKKAGLDDKYLTKVLREGLQAKQVKYFQYEGKVIDKRVDVDHNARHKFLDTAHKLAGNYSPEKLEVGDTKEIQAIAETLAKLAKK